MWYKISFFQILVLIYADKPVKELFVAKKTGGLGDDQKVLMDDLDLQPGSVKYYNIFWVSNLLKMLNTIDKSHKYDKKTKNIS